MSPLPRPTASNAISIPTPISASKFLEHFQRAWTESQSRLSWLGRRKGYIPRRLGLAVSGGADSMALAYLCRQLETSKVLDGMTVTAFVVDHKAREESTLEAKMVAGWLEEIGILTKILPLTWPNDNNLSNLTAFETYARRLRFQALGIACRDRNIETLLMGHHRDDNVETTLWRLCTGARGVGLMGIPRVARIPECHGLYGVAESGSFVNLSTSTTATTKISTGGILICRPLLSFPKSSLLATCHENKIPFVNDPTNFDPTLTPRNAIRSLMSTTTTTTTGKLPRALQTPSILSLIGKSGDLLRESMEFSNRVLRGCRVLALDFGAGVVVVEFPSTTATATATVGKEGKKLHQIQALTLRRITELISPFPENYFPLRSFEGFTHRVFPNTNTVSSSSATLESEKVMNQRQAFTLGGVLFRPYTLHTNTNSNKSRDTKDDPNEEKGQGEEDEKNEKKNIWILSRQPFMRNRLPVLRFDLDLNFDTDETTESQNYTPNYTPWTLWDNRYWFRVAAVPVPVHTPAHTPTHTPTPIPGGDEGKDKNISLLIRPFQQSDLKKVYNSLDEGSDKHTPPPSTKLKKQLSQKAPGHVRFTMPLIVMENSNDGDQIPLALPTMQVRLPLSLSLPRPAGSWKLEWEWMYKMVDVEVLELMGWSNKDGINSIELVDTHSK